MWLIWFVSFKTHATIDTGIISILTSLQQGTGYEAFTSDQRWGKDLFVIIVATACCNKDSVTFNVVDQTIFFIDSSTELALQVAF